MKFVDAATNVDSFDTGRDDDDFPGEVLLPDVDSSSAPVKSCLTTSPSPSTMGNAPTTNSKPSTTIAEAPGSFTQTVPGQHAPSTPRQRTLIQPVIPVTPQMNREPPRPHPKNDFIPQPEDDLFLTPMVPVEQSDVRRYPDRERRRPRHLEDYAKYTNDICCMSMAAPGMKIPETYKQAVESPQSDGWKKAMDSEMSSLRENGTFDVVSLPQGEKAIKGRWVYTLKEVEEGIIHKARFVAKGFSQVEGRDYTETFAPTPKMTSIRAIIQIAAQNKFSVHQMDVKRAYLNAPIDCKIYVVEPEGYKSDRNVVWKLKKSLDGLKQSGKNWNDFIHKFLIDHDFTQFEADPCVYFFTNNDGYLVICCQS